MASITCAHCKRTHTSVAQVRACATGTDGDSFDNRTRAQKEQAPEHDTPCVCSVYNRCNAQRERDYQRSGNWRDLHRAYND